MRTGQPGCSTCHTNSQRATTRRQRSRKSCPAYGHYQTVASPVTAHERHGARLCPSLRPSRRPVVPVHIPTSSTTCESCHSTPCYVVQRNHDDFWEAHVDVRRHRGTCDACHNRVTPRSVSMRHQPDDPTDVRSPQQEMRSTTIAAAATAHQLDGNSRSETEVSCSSSRYPSGGRATPGSR